MQVASILMPPVLQRFSRKQIDVGPSSNGLLSLLVFELSGIFCFTFCVFNECMKDAHTTVLVLFSTWMCVCKDMFNYVEM